MKTYTVFDEEFAEYGKVISGIDTDGFIRLLNNTECPSDCKKYVASDQILENTELGRYIWKTVYGELPIQIGHCNGYNKYLNALEYHKSSEINVAGNDLILLLGREQDITDNYVYDSSKVKAFFVPAGTVIEVYATTLHFAPCSVGDTVFHCAVILPRGTNSPVKEQHGSNGEDRMIRGVNKWVIAHPDSKMDGAYYGISGDNIKVD